MAEKHHLQVLFLEHFKNKSKEFFKSIENLELLKLMKPLTMYIQTIYRNFFFNQPNNKENKYTQG